MKTVSPDIESILPPDSEADTADGAWFDEHPERRHRLRQPGAHELVALQAAHGPDVAHAVAVGRIGQTTLAKAGFTVPALPPADVPEEMAALLFRVNWLRGAAI